MDEIEESSSKELSSSTEVSKILHLTDVVHVNSLLKHMEKASTRSEREVVKKVIIKALLISTWMQNLYFVIR
jgi:hypothetical protein